MALIKGANLEDILKELVTSYNDVFVKTTSAVSDLVLDQDISQTQFVHAFMSAFPDYRTWVDERIVNSVKIEEIGGAVEKKELTIGVAVDDLKSGNSAMWKSQLAALGRKSATLKDKMLAEFLQNGTSTAAKYLNYDGLPLFSDSHTFTGGTQDNNLGLSLSESNLVTAFEAFMGMKDPSGSGMGVKPTHIIVPSQLYLTAKALVENPIDASGATNVLYGLLKVVHLPELDSVPATWYLVAVKDGIPPFMNYVFEAPSDTALDQDTDHNVFWNDQVVFGSVAKMAIRAGIYQLVMRSVG